jgi:hypothetical protein
LKSPKRPLGKSSHVAALLSSPRPASPSVAEISDKVEVAVAVAFVGVIKSVELSGTGPVGVPTEGVSWNVHDQWVVIVFENDAHNYEFIERSRSNPCPSQSLQDTLYTFFKVQSAKMESIDACFRPKPFDHIHRQPNTVVFDQLIVVLMNK